MSIELIAFITGIVAMSVGGTVYLWKSQSAQDEKIGDNEKEIAVIQNNNKTLNRDVAEIKGDVKGLVGAVGDIKVAVGKMSVTVGETKGTVESIKRVQADQAKRLAGVETEQKAQGTRIVSIEKEMRELKGLHEGPRRE